MARILLENVTKIFDGEVTAVRDFNLEVPDGEFMVIVGPSGCGKTTTLRMIAGLEETTSGNIYIGDSLVNNVSPKDRDVAMVFQNYALYPHMNAYHNMAFALKMRNVPRAEVKKRIKETAKLLGIEHLLHRKPGALSGGQRQRVALGRAIVRRPRAFLFDEPLSNLDAAMRLTTRAELKNLHHRLKITTIYVTHDQAEAMCLGDRICVVREGEIQQTADPMEVYERPANKFVAGFLGTPPMNFLTGSIKLKNDTAYFKIGNDAIILSQRFKNVLRDYYDKQLILGVRPENISPQQFSGQSDNAISAMVNVIKPIGIRTDVYLTHHTEQKLIIGIEPHARFEVNDKVKLYLDLEKIHIFEPTETGRNVTLSDQPG
ncbi:MAG TPA: glycerol-3-phosphate ABC transporter ATP-binding protein [Phycisphaerales bacterium]|nr:glycerol-3-phosphate ABC transporter ATP-binding protein [Phycisphaerales bacterium]